MTLDPTTFILQQILTHAPDLTAHQHLIMDYLTTLDQKTLTVNDAFISRLRTHISSQTPPATSPETEIPKTTQTQLSTQPQTKQTTYPQNTNDGSSIIRRVLGALFLICVAAIIRLAHTVTRPPTALRNHEDEKTTSSSNETPELQTTTETLTDTRPNYPTTDPLSPIPAPIQTGNSSTGDIMNQIRSIPTLIRPPQSQTASCLTDYNGEHLDLRETEAIMIVVTNDTIRSTNRTAESDIDVIIGHSTQRLPCAERDSISIDTPTMTRHRFINPHDASLGDEPNNETNIDTHIIISTLSFPYTHLIAPTGDEKDIITQTGTLVVPLDRHLLGTIK